MFIEIKNDDDYLHYTCGSNETNYFQYSWICIVGFIGCIFLFAFAIERFIRKKENVVAYLKTLWKQSEEIWASSMEPTMHKILRIQLALLLFILIVGLPLYSIWLCMYIIVYISINMVGLYQCCIYQESFLDDNTIIHFDYIYCL